MKRPLLGGLTLASLAACQSVDVQVDAGYTQVAVSGDIALAEGTQGTDGAPKQDVDSAFGLGDEQGSPYLRASCRTAGFSFAASGFMFEESGRGVLEANFGGLPAATPVTSDLEFACVKVSGTYDFDLGFMTLAPGLAMDVVDLEFRVQELALGNGEEIDEVVGVPMVFLRASGDLGVASLMGEIGYMEAEIDSSGGSYLDAEVTLRVSPMRSVHFFGGYRFIDFDAEGDTGTDSFSVDLQVQGWVLGGGISF